MALNDLIGKSVMGLGLGLILSCSGAADENVSGCKHDSECKGNRICIDGECVEGNGGDGYSPKDTSSNCEDECVAGEKECLDSQVMECGNYDNDSCSEWEVTEECNSPEYCENGQCKKKECNPDEYINSCGGFNGLFLTYCDKNGEIKSLDCKQENYSQCGFVDGISEAACFGEGQFGEDCYWDEEKTRSGCDFSAVETCSGSCYEDMGCSSGFCTFFCTVYPDCPEDMFFYQCPSDCPEGYYCSNDPDVCLPKP